MNAPPTNLHGILMVGFLFKMWSSIFLNPEQCESQRQLLKVIGCIMLAQRIKSPVVEELMCYWINLFLWMFVIYWSLWNMVHRSEVRGLFCLDIINFKFSLQFNEQVHFDGLHPKAVQRILQWDLLQVGQRSQESLTIVLPLPILYLLFFL